MARKTLDEYPYLEAHDWYDWNNDDPAAPLCIDPDLATNRKGAQIFDAPEYVGLLVLFWTYRKKTGRPLPRDGRSLLHVLRINERARAAALEAESGDERLSSRNAASNFVQRIRKLERLGFLDPVTAQRPSRAGARKVRNSTQRFTGIDRVPPDATGCDRSVYSGDTNGRLSPEDAPPHTPPVQTQNSELRETNQPSSGHPARPDPAGDSLILTSPTSGHEEPQTYAGFERAWKAYPHFERRSRRGESLAVWKAHNLEQYARFVVAWIKAFAATDDWQKENGKFVKGMQSWLRVNSRDLRHPPMDSGEETRPDGKKRRRKLLADLLSKRRKRK